MPTTLPRTLLILVSIACVAVAGSWFQTQRPVAVRIEPVEHQRSVRVFGLGTVEARIVSQISFEVSATLAVLTADHGDHVAHGAVLARLHTAAQEARVAKAKAGLMSAEVGVRKAEANVTKARAVLEQRRESNRRQQALVGRQIVSEQTAEEAKRDADVAAAEIAVALSEVEVAKARLAEARADLTYEQTLLGHHMLTAPFDAVVVERHKEVGTMLKAGDPVFTLLAPQTVWVLAHVDEARAGTIREGQLAAIHLRSLPQTTFKARVTRIGIASDRISEERRVWLTFEVCPPGVHLGEQAEVHITVAHLDQALLVPEAAVTGFDGRTGTVWIVQDGRLQRQALAFGHRSEDARLEVVDGLPAGAAVVAGIGAGLRVGRAAGILTEGAP